MAPIDPDLTGDLATLVSRMKIFIGRLPETGNVSNYSPAHLRQLAVLLESATDQINTAGVQYIAKANEATENAAQVEEKLQQADAKLAAAKDLVTALEDYKASLQQSQQANASLSKQLQDTHTAVTEQQVKVEETQSTQSTWALRLAQKTSEIQAAKLLVEKDEKGWNESVVAQRRRLEESLQETKVQLKVHFDKQAEELHRLHKVVDEKHEKLDVKHEAQREALDTKQANLDTKQAALDARHAELDAKHEAQRKALDATHKTQYSTIQTKFNEQQAKQNKYIEDVINASKVMEQREADIRSRQQVLDTTETLLSHTEELRHEVESWKSAFANQEQRLERRNGEIRSLKEQLTSAKGDLGQKNEELREANRLAASATASLDTLQSRLQQQLDDILNRLPTLDINRNNKVLDEATAAIRVASENRAK
ncbi:hypothetical protein N0V82_008470 [Gnomoniopsis sp. IMI 355080]|nr:hypothetical protein N0V82_008470 [Gnomoniopsis sp. IMI 355080]